ncbi:MBL fold metallo-hydrolase [bacterium]|nr:MBL fold metallo-hydrolase [bacterium]
MIDVAAFYRRKRIALRGNAMMRLHLLGATGEVTGSSSLLEVGKKKVLVDFGLFQGAKFALEKNRRLPPVDVRKIDAVVLTHAHLDHSGRLPMLARLGYKGPIYASPATIDLTRLLLGDSARIQQSDAERAAKRLVRQGRIPPEPLYDEEDVATIMSQFVPMPMNKTTQVTQGVSVLPHDAGHILGSTSLKFHLEEAGQTRIVVFSGDIGVRDTPLLCDPEPFHEAHWVVMESTYGDRDHRSIAATIEEFLQILVTAEAEKRRVLIPAFAVGRTQQLLYYIGVLTEQGRLPESLPVYLDSPMARAATQLHLDHPELLDDETKRKDFCARLDRLKKRVRIVESRADSMSLNDDWSPCVIIAGSGMCNGGRIVHHLKHSVWRHNTDVLMVGYQSNGTLGSQLVKGLKKVRILGQMIEVRAKIHTLGGFSAHAGQTELLDWLKPLAARKPMVLLNHGEDRSREALAEKIRNDFGLNVTLPEPETSFDL